jgi:hypothetical protein
MSAGIVYLAPLYKWVRNFTRQHPYKPDDPDTIAPYRVDRSNKPSREYLKVCIEVLDKVPNNQGFYLWGFYNSNRFWVNVYLGKAIVGKTAHLRDRLYKELTAENASIWREVNKDNVAVLAIGQKIHPVMWPTYKAQWQRALRKAGSTHIFWVAASDLPAAHIDLIESDLIEAMNPTGNRQRKVPSAKLQREAGEILKTFRELVHLEENRKTKFSLKYHKDFWKWVGKTEPSTP